MITISTLYRTGMESVHEMPFLSFEEVAKVARTQIVSASVVKVEVEDENRILVIDKSGEICYDITESED
jgi:hypothetical protein